MAITTKKHWKKFFNKKFIVTWSIADGVTEPIMTISKFDVGEVQNADGTEEKLIIYFKEDLDGKNLPMILNATNCKVLEDTYSKFPEDWVGKTIQLYVDKRVRAFGKNTDGLRLRKPPAAVKKTELTPKSKNWEAARKSVLAGTVDYEGICKHYSISKENYALLSKK